MRKIPAILTAFLLAVISQSCSSGFDKGQVVSVSTECVGASSKEALDSLSVYGAGGNEAAFKEVINSGRAKVLPKGIGAIVVGYELDKVQIELIDGRRFWVLKDHLEK